MPFKSLFDYLLENAEPISESSIMTELERQAAGIIDDPVKEISDLERARTIVLNEWLIKTADSETTIDGDCCVDCEQEEQWSDCWKTCKKIREEVISRIGGIASPGDKGDSSN